MIVDGLTYLTQAASAEKETWFNVHRRLTFQDGRLPIFPGNAHQNLRSAAEDADYWAQRGQCVYLAQGIFRSAGEMGKVYPKAIRQEPNLIACKNLYMDIDVKQGGYSSEKDALVGLKDFLAQSKLPLPTIIVGSGNGGLHVYWTLDTEFEPREFRRMAGQLIAAGDQHGLLFDRQCTRDAIRLLRIPGTWNFKGGPGTDGKPVTLKYCERSHIALSVMQKALSGFKPAGAGPSTSTHQSKSGVNDDLAGDMKREHPPANIDAVAALCPFIKQTLAERGANLIGEPQWHLVAGLSCHCDDPTATFERLSDGHPNYNPEDAERKLATALQARKDRPSIGPEKCATIHNQYHIQQCAACPHLHLGTTPLSVQFKRPNGQAYTGAATNSSPNSIDLPLSYLRGNDNLIYKSITDGEGNTELVLVLPYQIIPGSAHVEFGIPFQIVLTTIQGGKEVVKRFDSTIVADDTAFAKAWAAVGLPITTPVKLARILMSNYLKLLQERPDTLIDAPAFGWSLDSNNQKGFAFASKFFSPAGEFKSSRPGDGVEDYRAVGDTKPWQKLAKILLTPNRPDLCCMIASTFAAPLVEMTGHAGLLLGLISSESGIGKSTALQLGQAVWSKPIVGGLSDTINYTFAKCITLRHLPLFYDEIKGDKQMRAMVELAFQLTGGHEKGRSDRSGKMRKVNSFTTLCGYCGNTSIVDAVRNEDKGTDASWLRMFEMQAIITPNTGQEFAYAVNEHSTELHFNYGGVGLSYAKFLGENHDKTAKTLVAMQRGVAYDLSADPKIQRYWIDAIATVLVGAMIANVLGLCTFPIAEMKAYMYTEFRRMRQEMAENPNDFGVDLALISTLGAFLNEKLPRNTVILNRTQTGAGKPSKDIKILNDAPHKQWGTLEVQLSGSPLVLRITDSALGAWCKRTGRPKANLQAAMKKTLGAKMLNVVIGAGSHLAGAKENTWVIDATGTVLEASLEYTIAHGKFEPPIP